MSQKNRFHMLEEMSEVSEMKQKRDEERDKE